MEILQCKSTFHLLLYFINKLTIRSDITNNTFSNAVYYGVDQETSLLLLKSSKVIFFNLVKDLILFVFACRRQL